MSTNLPGQQTPQLEYYQTDNNTLIVEEADGPTGAWIEFDPNWGAK